MVPMPIDSMIPGAATLFAITPAFLGVVLALVAVVAVALRGTLHELDRPDLPRRAPSQPTPRVASPRLAA